MASTSTTATATATAVFDAHDAQQTLADLKETLTTMQSNLVPPEISDEILQHALLPYQRALTSSLDEMCKLRTSQADAESVPALSSDLRAARADLVAMQAQLEASQLENTTLQNRLTSRDAAIASDAAELSRLRMEAATIPSLRHQLQKATSDAAEASSQLSDHKTRAVARAKAAETSLQTLQTQLAHLTAELSVARGQVDAANLSTKVSVQEVNLRAETALTELTSTKSELSSSRQAVQKLEGDLANTRVAVENVKKTYEAEIASLNETVKLHEQRAEEAEGRARDCEEAMLQERQLADQASKVQTRAAVMDPHFEVLLRNLEEALDSRWHALEKQKEEMERARESEMHMAAQRARLKRDATEARMQAEQARKEVVRQRRQMDEQAEELQRLKRQTEDRGRASLSTPFVHAPTSASAELPPPSLWRRPSSTGMPSLGLPSPAVWTLDDNRRGASVGGAELGPRSVIPTHYESPAAARASEMNGLRVSMQELTAMRKRHETLLEQLRDRRLSSG